MITVYTFQFIGNNACPQHVKSYLWDFGDGTTSTLANPSHSYLTAPPYTIVLTVTYDDGTVVSKTHTAP